MVQRPQNTDSVWNTLGRAVGDFNNLGEGFGIRPTRGNTCSRHGILTHNRPLLHYRPIQNYRPHQPFISTGMNPFNLFNNRWEQQPPRPQYFYRPQSQANWHLQDNGIGTNRPLPFYRPTGKPIHIGGVSENQGPVEPIESATPGHPSPDQGGVTD